ncbi:VanZ family protein [Bacillus spongiae]|uniref:VanZ family protein n=1 Tax=Bacillus spongiae TaxID=2683610 RepID=A0ABU8HAV3_9BACI
MQKVLKVGLGISFIIYLFILVVILFLGQRAYTDLSLLEYIKRSSNIIPFNTISKYITAIFDGSMNINIPIQNLFGNVILFFPMGVYLPFFIKKVNKVSAFFILMVVLIFWVEFIQLVTRRGSFDINDFILNVLGALIGLAIWKSKTIEKYLNRTNHDSLTKSVH